MKIKKLTFRAYAFSWCEWAKARNVIFVMQSASDDERDNARNFIFVIKSESDDEELESRNARLVIASRWNFHPYQLDVKF